MGSKDLSDARGPSEHGSGRTHSRPLAGVERTLAAFSRRNPINLVILVGLDGPPLDDALPGALDALQRRHPLLRASISGPALRPRFDIAAAGEMQPIPVGVPRGADSLPAVVEHEMNTPFDTAHGPLARLTIVRAEARTDLVLTLHHAIADGASAANLVHELLERCGAQIAGEPTPQAEATAVPPPLTELLPARLRGSRRRWLALRYLFAQGRDEVAYRLGSLGRRLPVAGHGRAATTLAHLDREQTAALVDRSRRHRLTLTSLLSAALIEQASAALYRGRPGTMRVLVWVDLRPHLEPRPPDEVLGCYFSMLRFVLRIDPGEGFAALAARARDAIDRASRRTDLATAALVTGRLAAAAARWPAGRLATTAVSYATAPAIRRSYGPLEIRELRAFVSNVPAGAELALAAGIARGELWCDLLYWDSDISAAASAAAGDGLIAALRGFAGA